MRGQILDDVWRKFRQVRVLALDFDGVLTDGTVFMDVAGRESVRCSHRDGQGIVDVRAAGIEVVVISSQTSEYVAARCKKMGVPYYYKATHKLRTLESFLATLREPVTLEQVCFVGDDRGDLEVMRAVGIPCTVADGIPECHDVAVIVTARHGGDHAVREVCDRILEARKGA